MNRSATAPPAKTRQPAAIPRELERTGAELVSSVIAAICRDAQRDACKYLLRSNTNHDGE